MYGYKYVKIGSSIKFDKNMIGDQYGATTIFDPNAP